MESNNSSISIDIVYRVCTMVELGYTYREICEILKLEPETKYRKWISDIVRKRIYRKISKDFNFPERRNIRFTPKEVKTICKYISDGYSVRDIATIIGYKNHCYRSIRSTVMAIHERKWYKNISKRYVFPEKIVTSGFVKYKK